MDDSPTLDGTDRESDCDLDSLYDSIKEHDDIRFATYRTAAKMRYVQRKGYLHHIDIWNVIEAFRENGLNTMEATTLVNRARLETLLSSLYSNLNKRLPPGQNIDVDKTSSLMATWLLFSLCSDHTNRLKVFSIKICLAILSCGKLMDKLRYIFSQLTDCNGQLMLGRFTHFMEEMCKLPSAVGEGRTFNITESTSEVVFNSDAKVNVNDFLETLMSDPGPHCVSWLIVLHRISAAESNYHPVGCSGCGREGFSGLRYKSDSSNYHLCQLCFWRGDMTEEHKDDVFKEYSAWKTPGKPSGLRRSIRCVAPPSSAQESQRIPRFPDKPEETLDLSNIVPASPLPNHNGFQATASPLPSHNGFHADPPGGRRVSPATLSGIDKLAMTRLHGGATASPQPARRFNQQQQQMAGNPPFQRNQLLPGGNQLMPPNNQFSTIPQTNVEKSSHRGKTDEHELIACYANHLADQSSSLSYLGLAGRGGTDSSPEEAPPHPVHHRRDKPHEKDSRRLVYELEKKNAEIMREIARLRQNRASVQDMEKDPNVVTELEVLRQRRAELETRLGELQETRKDLMVELEELMKILRVQGAPREGPGMSREQQQQQLPGFRQEDFMRGKSYQACKFSQITKHQNVSSKLRPGMSLVPASLPGGGVRAGDGGATTISSPESTSMPASVNSLSE